MADDGVRLNDLIWKCQTSRERRKSAYAWLRMWYARGTEYAGAPARYNKLASHIELLTSYLYAPESTRFSLWLPPKQRRVWLEHADVARDEFMAVWRDSGADVTFGSVTEWALVYGSALCKIIPDAAAGPRVSYVFPGDFGVLREELPSLDQQEVFVHWYYLSVGEVARLARGHKDEAEIIRWAREHATPGPTNRTFPAMVQQMITTNINAGQPNSGIQGLHGLDYPETEEPLVELAEVWERADFKTKGGQYFEDYMVSTICNTWPMMIRRNPVLPWRPNEIGDDLPGENAFVIVSASQMLDYIWGRSALAGLVQLQNWRELRFNQLDTLFAMQADPPRWGTGMGLTDEKLYALRRPGGAVASPMPNAKIETIKIDIPEDAMALVREIDTMFGDSAGIPSILEGTNDPGVRAGNQVGALANIAVGRIRKKALHIEDALEVLATRMWRLMQRHDDTAYAVPKGDHFLLAQLPAESKMKVDAHSASPVYADQIIQKAQLLLQGKAIDLVTFVEMVDPPGVASLKERARILQESQAEMAEKMLQVEVLKAKRRGR